MRPVPSTQTKPRRWRQWLRRFGLISAVSRRGGGRHGRRRVVRVRRRPAADLRSSTTTRPARSRASSAATARSSASSRPNAAQIVTYDRHPGRAAQRDHRRRGRRLLHAQRHRTSSASPSPPCDASWACSDAAAPARITQQLARKLFLTDDSYARSARSRKRCSRSRSKSGTRSRKSSRCTATRCTGATDVYGVEAASQLYFAKSVKELTLDEAALIAGMLQGNVRQSPYVNPEAALARRNYVLGRMAAEGFITADAAAAAKKRPIVTRGEPARCSRWRPTFSKPSAAYLEEHYGAKALYEGGLVVTTGLDVELQRAANRALDAALARARQGRGVPQARAQRARRDSDRSTPSGIRAGRAICRRATSCRRW